MCVYISPSVASIAVMTTAAPATVSAAAAVTRTRSAGRWRAGERSEGVVTQAAAGRSRAWAIVWYRPFTSTANIHNHI